jgi:thiosulfate dehydrogenase
MRNKIFSRQFSILGLLFFAALVCVKCADKSYHKQQETTAANSEWHAPDTSTIASMPGADLIKYGRELIVNTAAYLGPKGAVAHISNGMNCGNCHLEGGTRSNGNNFASVAFTYPRFRMRSGKKESIQFRIEDCMQRSLNGKKLDSNGKEMTAMVAYIRWLGKDVTSSTVIKKDTDLPCIERAASIKNGAAVYALRCITCHGANGNGLTKPDSTGYIYPPLWGPDSYNTSAGNYMLSKLASFVKHNMPYTVKPQAAVLTDEEAWDVAAFVNSQNRPVKMFADDWPVLSTKPVDYPFGPYTDTFSELQHKYGPFTVMKKEAHK